jgi:hypothetical protein
MVVVCCVVAFYTEWLLLNRLVAIQLVGAYKKYEVDCGGRVLFGLLFNFELGSHVEFKDKFKYRLY